MRQLLFFYFSSHFLSIKAKYSRKISKNCFSYHFTIVHYIIIFRDQLKLIAISPIWSCATKLVIFSEIVKKKLPFSLNFFMVVSIL